MTIRQINLVLQIASGATVAVAAAVLVAAVAVPLSSGPDGAADATKIPKPIATSPTTQLSSAGWTAVSGKTLRHGLDVAASTSNVAAPVVSGGPDAITPQQVQVTGTIGTSLAILRAPDGSEALAEIGDDLNGATVTAIRIGEVDFKSADGHVTTLKAAPSTQPTVDIASTRPAAENADR